MLRDEEIDAAASQVAAYRKSAELDSILAQYADLIADYRRLKSDFEEERDAREKYKQLARSREQSPFVLVLVDGDGYVFHESFLDKGGEGGNNAAHALNSAVASSLAAKGLGGCQVMVRIYANVAGLSKALARNGLAGNEARSLSPFLANFNRSYGLTDFVDAGSLKENADFKIRAALGFYADSPQCKHIYFAACHDVGYISELTPFLGNSDKFTLVRSPSVKFHPEFTKLGMGIENIPGVFRTVPLTTTTTTIDTTTTALHRGTGTGTTTFAAITASVTSTTSAGPNDGFRKSPSTSSYQPPATDTTTPTSVAALLKASKDEAPTPSSRTTAVCQFNKQGKCRFGKSCKLAHVVVVDDDGFFDGPGGPGGNGSIRVNGGGGGGGGRVPTWKGRPLEDADIPRDQVAVNRADHRLDSYLSASSDAIAKLRARARNRGLCNRFHLAGDCEAGSRCEFDHSWLAPDLLAPLESLARSMPCSRRGACRAVDCTKGHICQTLDCRCRGGKVPCKIPHSAHAEDLRVDRFVDGRRDCNNSSSTKAESTGRNGDETESSDGVSISISA